MVDIRNGARQTSFRIMVSTDSAGLTWGKAIQWNTEWLQTNVALRTYGGKPLKAFTKYYWRIDLQINFMITFANM